MKPSIITHRHTVNYTFTMTVLVLGLFLLLICPRLMSEGMFIDGLYYANVARNMAEGTGSSWHMMFTDISPFYGHPPLAMTMESMLFRLFGDHLWVEKVYSLLMTFISAWLIAILWRCAGGRKSLAWMPMLLLVLNPTVIFCAPNNLLENTMMVFVLLAALCIIKSYEKCRFTLVATAGLFVACAFFTKGPTGLYTLAFPIILWTTVRRRNFGAAVVDTIVMAGTTFISVAAVLLVDNEACAYMSKYFEIQVVNGMSAEVVSSRFTIVRQFFERTAIDLALVAIILAAAVVRHKKKHSTMPISNASARMALALTLLTICGVLPIMISTKQHSFYILTVYPFFSIALSLLIQDIVVSWRWTKNTKVFCSVAILAALIMNSSIAAMVIQSHRPSMYDPVMLNDMHLIVPHLDKHETIQSKISGEWQLEGYYQRQWHVSFTDKPCRHVLSKENTSGWTDTVSNLKYHKVDIPTSLYHLYESSPSTCPLP